MKFNCKDCKKEITPYHKRCRACANKNRTGTFKWKQTSIAKRNGKGNPNWKGTKISYRALHKYIERHKLKPLLCEDCGKVPPYDLANISGKYKRDVNDYKWLCRKCHMNSDGRIIKLHFLLKQTLWKVKP